MRTKHDAENVVPECVLVAFERFEKLRDHQAFASYLFTIASRIVKRRRWVTNYSHTVAGSAGSCCRCYLDDTSG